MATVRQIEANRRNAQRSTGPRTEEGKSRARYNAFKHGLAANTILPHENLLEYHEIRAALIETWQPATPQEMMEVDNLTMGWWCMQRSNRFERRLFELQLQHMKTVHHAATTAPHPDDDGGIAASFCSGEAQKAYQLLLRYDSRASSKYYRAMDHLIRLQSLRTRKPQPPPAIEDTIAQPVEISTTSENLASFGPPAAVLEMRRPETQNGPANWQPAREDRKERTERTDKTR